MVAAFEGSQLKPDSTSLNTVNQDVGATLDFQEYAFDPNNRGRRLSDDGAGLLQNLQRSTAQPFLSELDFPDNFISRNPTIPKPRLNLSGQAGTANNPITIECDGAVANAWELKMEGAEPEVMRRRRSRRLSDHPMRETLVEYRVESVLLAKIIEGVDIALNLDVAQVPVGTVDPFEDVIELLGSEGAEDAIGSRRLLEKLSRRRLTQFAASDAENFEIEVTEIEPTCDSITWKYQVTYEDATGISDPIYIFARLNYGGEEIGNDVPTVIATRCDSDPYSVEDLEESRTLKDFYSTTTLIPTLNHKNCPNPYLYLTHQDSVTKEGTPCTTEYKEIERKWSVLSHNDACSVDGIGALETQTVVLGGALDPVTNIPATPVFDLRDVSYELPYVGVASIPPIATVSTNVSDFYLDDKVPLSECGLCSDPTKAIVYSHPQDFDCTEEGDNEISITVLNQIGVAVTKTATVTVFGNPDTDGDGMSDICDPDDDNDGVLDPDDSTYLARNLSCWLICFDKMSYLTFYLFLLVSRLSYRRQP